MRSEYLKLDTGELTTVDDPDRGIWYAAGESCGYWTDNWRRVRNPRAGVPCCPVCGVPGFQIEAKEWWEGAAEFEKKNPHYQEFLAASKEVCTRKQGINFLDRYEQFKAKKESVL